MKKIIFIFFISMTTSSTVANQDTYEKKYECLTEARVSGLFQFERKFLKDTDFFPDKTTLNFTENYTLLTEMENTKENKFEAKYQFNCKNEEKINSIICRPVDDNNTYNIVLSLDSLRYRKTLITNYWLFGKGNEVDYVHIAHGYCYDID